MSSTIKNAPAPIVSEYKPFGVTNGYLESIQEWKSTSIKVSVLVFPIIALLTLLADLYLAISNKLCPVETPKSESPKLDESLWFQILSQEDIVLSDTDIDKDNIETSDDELPTTVKQRKRVLVHLPSSEEVSNSHARIELPKSPSTTEAESDVEDDIDANNCDSPTTASCSDTEELEDEDTGPPIRTRLETNISKIAQMSSKIMTPTIFLAKMGPPNNRIIAASQQSFMKFLSPAPRKQ